MFTAISRITDETQGITAGTQYTIVNTKHQSSNSICILNDFGIHSRVKAKDVEITITAENDYNSKLNIVQRSAI